MRLAAGARLGPYEIISPLGAGGMGEVYRATDTRLGRDVALKVLSPDTSSSPDARRRFEREARTISQLSHPHICALYDVGEAPNPQSPIPNPYLVMELLEGETLAQRLKSGALPLELTLRYAMQIADALEKAHRAGIVHRDLKPANVMITKSGVKLLDFGLAKPVEAAPLSAVQTAPPPLTARGAIAGTVQYMAPEQLAGRSADARSDLYAFCAIIYEMAAGKPAFGNTLQPLQPPALDRIVRGGLAIDPDERWQSAHDVGLQLRTIASAGETLDAVPSATAPTRRWVGWLPWAVAAMAIAAAAAAWLRPAPVPRAVAQTVRMTLAPPDGGFSQSFESVGMSVSPDGSRIAFSARRSAGLPRLWMRTLAESESRPIDGTDGATSMFWSPDGRSLAYFAGAKLRRVDVRGGAPVSICDVREGIGWAGTWGADGQILYASIEGEAIWRVSAAGGVPVAILKPDPALNEARLNWPFFLPDGRRFLYLQRRRDGSGHLMYGEPGQPAREVRPLHSGAQYVAPGYLVFAEEGSLVAQRFDASRGTVIGDPFSIADNVVYFYSTTYAAVAVSPGGTLVFAAHDDQHRLAWFDRAGGETGSIGELGRYQRLRFAPDGRRFAFDRLDKAGAFDLWEMDVQRRAETRLTFGQSSEGGAAWNPDGRSLFFSADHGGPPRIFRKDLVSGREELVLPDSGTFQEAQDVSPDGRTLLYTQRAAGGNDLWQWPTDGSRQPTTIVATPFDENMARFSPDGRAVSFHSNVSGRYEVYVAPFPPTGEQWRVSTSGGLSGRWGVDGREILYMSLDGRLMSAPVRSGSTLSVGAPVGLFTMKRPWIGFDVDSAGRFLAVIPESRAADQPLTVVLNWQAALGARERR